MPTVELLPVTYDPDKLHMWADENFRRISDAIGSLASPSAGGGGSGLAVPAGNVIAGAFGANVGNGNYTFPGTLGVASLISGTSMVLNSGSVDNLIVKGGGATIRLEARDAGDFVAMYRTGTVTKFWDSTVGTDRFGFEPSGRSRHGMNISGECLVGPWTGDPTFAAYCRTSLTVANSGHYGLLIGGTDTYVSGASIWFRAENNGGTQVRFDNNYVKEFFGNSGNWDIGGGVRARIWNDGEFWCQSVGLGGDNGYNKGLTISNDGWIRHYTADIGWHNEARGAGMMGAATFGNQTCTTNNNETSLIARKISQGGWATAGLSSFAESSSAVPYISMHANGCCTTNWRKDSGASYVVDVNSGGGCDWVYAANHPVCSERARKHNISVAEEYGLKTVRGLKPHKFQYTPTSEDEIFAWEKWKYDRSIGIWTHPPSEHMGWDDWHVGYFAEEMVNLVPEVVGLHPDGTPKGIDYGNLVVVAIAAINELADRLEDLEARSYAA